MSDEMALLLTDGMRPPRPGYCHNARCSERSTLMVQVQRINGAWTSGIDYCELHALDFAARTTLNSRCQPISGVSS